MQDIVEEITDSLNGQYFQDDIKKGHTPGGTFISQNSYGLIKKENYSIRIYCFSNSGTRAVNTLDGSPFKLVLILPFVLKQKINIFPKSFLKKIISTPKKYLSIKSKSLLKKYSLKGNKELVNYLLKDSELPGNISKHLIYISTGIHDGYSTLNLIPNESVMTKEDLSKLYNILDKLGEIIFKNKDSLKI